MSNKEKIDLSKLTEKEKTLYNVNKHIRVFSQEVKKLKVDLYFNNRQLNTPILLKQEDIKKIENGFKGKMKKENFFQDFCYCVARIIHFCNEKDFPKRKPLKNPLGELTTDIKRVCYIPEKNFMSLDFSNKGKTI